MTKHYDSTRTPEAKARTLARRKAHEARRAAKRETDAALRALMAPYRGKMA